MPRVKRGVTTGARHKKVLRRAKGYYNARRKNIKTANQAVMWHALRLAGVQAPMDGLGVLFREPLAADRELAGVTA